MFEILLIICAIILIALLIMSYGKPSDSTPGYNGNSDFRKKYCDTSPIHGNDIIVLHSYEEDIIKKKGKDYAFMVFDCETTGLPQNGPAYIIQLSWMLLDKNFNTLKEANYFIKPPIPIPLAATKINHITDVDVETKGSPLEDVLVEFHIDVLKSYRLVAHNFEFDADMIDRECHRLNMVVQDISHKQHICTMEKGINYCQILKDDGSYKRPKLIELAKECKVYTPDNMHNSMTDVQVTAKCLKHMLDYYVFKVKGINS